MYNKLFEEIEQRYSHDSFYKDIQMSLAGVVNLFLI